MITHINIVDGIGGVEGGIGPAANCDLEATLAAYVTEFNTELNKEFGDVRLSYRWENSNMGMKIDFEGIYPLEDYDDIRATIQQVGEDVYQRGTFWVAKEG